MDLVFTLAAEGAWLWYEYKAMVIVGKSRDKLTVSGVERSEFQVIRVQSGQRRAAGAVSKAERGAVEATLAKAEIVGSEGVERVD